MVNHPNRSRKSGARVTKHKDEAGWRIYVDGRPTTMLVCKDQIAPRFREPQMYFVTTDDDYFLMEAASVSALMERITRLLAELAP